MTFEAGFKFLCRKFISSTLPTTGTYLIQLKNYRLSEVKETLCMGHEAEPVLRAASAPAAARWEPVCPEAAVPLGSGSSYLHIVSCSLLWVHTGLARSEKGTAWHFA